MIYEAGLISLLRTLLILVGVYFAFRLIFRVLIPYLLKRFINKQHKKYYQQYDRNASFNDDQKSGEVHIKGQKKKSSTTEKLGDYVDYEEVSEDDK